MVRARSWCFTINNPTEEDKPLTWECKFLIFQLEKGDAGTTHYQGYVQFANPKTLAGVRGHNGRAHWEVAKGNADQNIAYCTKPEGREDGPWEKGTRPAQGKRSDLDDIADACRERKSLKEIAGDHPGSFIRYNKGICALRGLYAEPRTEKTKVLWFWGDTGTGKSKAASEIEGDLYWKDMSNGKWWDGYEQQDVVIFDDMRKDTFKFHELLRLFDRYPLRVETKGGSTQFNSKTIVVTSCHRWDKMWEHQSDECMAQLERRITETRHFNAGL